MKIISETHDFSTCHKFLFQGKEGGLVAVR